MRIQKAHLILLASFSSIMGGLGLMNSIGIYQAWIASHQLADLSSGKIGWIFGLYNFLVFFCGIQIGPIFDVHGPRFLMVIGSTLLVIMFVCLGFCYAYWHFILVVGLIGGMGTSFIFIVPVATIGHYFHENRGAATGFAFGGGSLGGVMFPLLLQHLGPEIGFAWATRAIGLITLVLLIPGLFLSCPPSEKPKARRNILPDLTILKSTPLALTTIGVFFIEWGFFIPLEYLASYALHEGMSTQLSSLMIVFLNAASFFGRWIPGIMADRVGRFNTLIITNAFCLVAVLAVWMAARGNVAATIVFAILFGFGSGSNISLVPVCVGELCATEDYGRFYTTVYTIVSFGALTGVPIAGEIVSRCQGEYWGLIVFAGCSYAAGLVCFVTVKMMLSKRKGEKGEKDEEGEKSEEGENGEKCEDRK
ncbi:hypothetical protein MW887_005981 [Aspergillus wentii]|nr:hypothetical protein MW887_005981 [Aspergillus wentii]